MRRETSVRISDEDEGNILIKFLAARFTDLTASRWEKLINVFLRL